jgi:serine/threonine-protein kinase
MTTTAPCDRERIQLFVEQQLDDREQSALEDHLTDCPVCRAALDQLVAPDDAWTDAQSLSHPGLDETPDIAGNLDAYRRMLGPTDDPRMLGRIGLHEIVGILGVGGMGVVFKGFDPTLNRYVAIKMLSPLFNASPVAQQRFMREAQSAAAVLHDNVIAIHSIDRWQDAPYIVMTYIRGESLRNRLSRRGPLSVREVLRIGMQIAAGLAAAHAQGLIHRDIKPGNILLETDVDRVKISDFGLARAVDDIRLTRSDTLIGTPQYMSPEQARDDLLDYRTDLFSLGSVLYEAAAGRAPFYASTSYGVLKRIVEHAPPPIRQFNSDIPEWLELLIAQLMHKDRDQRFSTAAEVDALLKSCLAHVEQPLLVALPAAVQPPRKLSLFSNRRWRLPMSLAALGLAAGLGTLVLSQLDTDQGATPKAGGDKPAAFSAVKFEKESASAKTAAGDGTIDVTIEVLGVANVSDMTMTTEFDISRMPVTAQTNSFEENKTGGGASSAFATSASGFGGGAGGAFGGKFLKPNIGVALKVDSKKSKPESIVKLASECTLVDDKGNTIEAKNLGPTVNHFAQFENQYPGARFLYVHGDLAGVESLASLSGQLLLVPGRKLSVTFDDTKKQTKKAGGETFKLNSFSDGDDGMTVSIVFPPFKNVKNAKSPQERFQAMLNNRGGHSAVVEDSEGEMHQASTVTSVNGNTTTSFSFNSNGGSSSSSSSGSGQGFSGKSDDSTESFSFAPLPEGRTLKKIHVTMEERTGDAKSVPFTIKDIPLK